MKTLSELAHQFEIASTAYAKANDITRNEDWFILKMQEDLDERPQVWMELTAS